MAGAPWQGVPGCAVGPGVGGSGCTQGRNVGWEGLCSSTHTHTTATIQPAATTQHGRETPNPALCQGERVHRDLGWPGHPCPLQSADVGPWAGSGQLGAHFHGMACCCLPHGHGGAVGIQHGVLDWDASPKTGAPAQQPSHHSICLHLPGPSQPLPGQGSLSGYTGQDRAHMGSHLGATGPLASPSPSSSTAATVLGCPLPQPYPVPPLSLAPTPSALWGWSSLGPPALPGVPGPAPAVPHRLLWGGVWRPQEQSGAGTLPSIEGAMDYQHCSPACSQPGLGRGAWYVACHPPSAPTGAAQPALSLLRLCWGEGAAELSLSAYRQARMGRAWATAPSASGFSWCYCSKGCPSPSPPWM